MNEKIKIFVSYSHEDEVWVSSTNQDSYKLIPWLDKQLKNTAEIWIDHALKELPGEAYTNLITKKILEADIALLLISQDFVSSEYIMTKELPLIKEQYDSDKIKIIPLLITKVSDDGKEGISWIFDLQTYPNDMKPLISFVKDPSEWSDAKVEILNGINNKIKSIRNPKPINDEGPKVPNKSEQKTIVMFETTTHFQNDIKSNSIQETSTDSINYKSFIETVNGVNFEMVSVDGGTFMMGSPSNEPNRNDDEVQHQVTLSSYSIGKTVVNQALWIAVMCKNTSHFICPYNPVEKVSWYDAVIFCNELSRLKGLEPAYSILGSNVMLDSSAKSFRLPTEAEWEFAARGGNLSKGYTYSGNYYLDKVAWYDINCSNKTHPVAQKQPNELGLYDMSGNVWEWCWDWWASYGSSPQTNPLGPTSGSYRVGRGGSWCVGEKFCRVAFRFNDIPIISHFDLGFRLVLPL